VDHTIRTPDGRELHVTEHGDPDGRVVLVHHGTPSDGSPHRPWVADAEAKGIRLLGYDRPGYGGSTPAPGRRVADAARDAETIADALGVERFATWGISGGGPHALACAALLGDRVPGAASLAGIAPFDAEGLNVFAGMGEDNIVEFGAAMQGREAITPLAEEQATGMREAAPADIAAGIRSLISEADQQALDAGIAEWWSGQMPNVFAHGAGGWIDDDLAFVAPFGFDVRGIDVPVLVVHGHHDRFVPVSHGQWLATRMSGAEAWLSIDDGHLTLIAHRVPAVHDWLLRRF